MTIDSSIGGAMGQEVPKVGDEYLYDGSPVQVIGVSKRRFYSVTFVYHIGPFGIFTVGGKEWFAKAVRA